MSEVWQPCRYTPAQLTKPGDVLCGCGHAKAAHNENGCQTCAAVPRPLVQHRVIVTTTDSVPGFDVAVIIGLVSGVGHPGYQGMTSTTASRGQVSLDTAYSELLQNARRMNADAVIGVALSTYVGGNRSVQSAVGVHLLGTAVTLAPSRTPHR